jgi:hypothetical protein
VQGGHVHPSCCVVGCDDECGAGGCSITICVGCFSALLVETSDDGSAIFNNSVWRNPYPNLNDFHCQLINFDQQTRKMDLLDDYVGEILV